MAQHDFIPTKVLVLQEAGIDVTQPQTQPLKPLAGFVPEIDLLTEDSIERTKCAGCVYLSGRGWSLCDYHEGYDEAVRDYASLL